MSWFTAAARRTADSTGAAVRGIALVPLLLRLTVAATGAGALAIALPVATMAPVVLAIVGVAVLSVAFAPGTWGPTVLQLLAVVGWVIDTTTFGRPVTWLPLAALAALLYLHHTTCALAAAVPLGVSLSPAVVVRWYARAGIVVAVTALLAAGALAAATRVQPTPDVVVPVVGVLLALGAVAYLVVRSAATRQWRR